MNFPLHQKSRWLAESDRLLDGDRRGRRCWARQIRKAENEKEKKRRERKREKAHLLREVQSHVLQLLFPLPAFLSGTLSLCKHFSTVVEKKRKEKTRWRRFGSILKHRQVFLHWRKYCPCNWKEERGERRNIFFLSMARLSPFPPPPRTLSLPTRSALHKVQ